MATHLLPVRNRLCADARALALRGMAGVLALALPGVAVPMAAAAAPALVAPAAATTPAPEHAGPLAPMAIDAAAAPGPAPEVVAQPPPADWLHLGVFGSNMWGGRGARRTASAFAVPRGSVALGLAMELFQSTGLFVTGDRSTLNLERVTFVYAPITGLELSVSERSVAFQYRQAQVPRNLMAQGNPALQAKYGRHIVGPLAVGARVSALVPPSAAGSGLAFSSTSIRAEALLSVQPLPWLEWMADVGYVYDGSRRQSRTLAADAVERFVYGANIVDRLLWSTAVQARVGIGRYVAVGGFAEVAGESAFSSGAKFSNSPLVASAGARVWPSQSRAVELTIGADARIAGAPAAGSPFAGTAPWQAFAQLAVHYNDPSAPQTSCVAASPVAAPLNPFRVVGDVHDATSGQVVSGAAITLAEEGAEHDLTRLAVDANDGKFVGYPMPRQGAPVRVRAEAPGYLAASQSVTRPAVGDALVALSLLRDQVQQQGRIAGAIRHAYTGKALAQARIAVRGLQREVVVDGRGMFSVSLPPGSYAATVRAKGFVTQSRTMQVSAGAALIWNVDLEPAGR